MKRGPDLRARQHKKHAIAALAVRVLADTVLLQLALIAGLAIRYYFAVLESVGGDVDLNQVYSLSVDFYRRTAIPLTVISIVIFYLNGFYTRGRYYQGKYKVLVVVRAVSLAYLCHAFLAFFIRGSLDFSRGGLLAAWLLSIALLVGARLWSQLWKTLARSEDRHAIISPSSSRRQVLVIGGAGYIGSALLPKLIDLDFDVRILDLMLFGEKTHRGNRQATQGRHHPGRFPPRRERRECHPRCA